MLRQLQNRLHNERGDVTYISVIIFTVIAMITITILLQVLSVTMQKNKLDAAVDQIARQIQLAGEMNSDTAQIADFLKQELKAENVSFTVDTSFIMVGTRTRCIQIGTPFYVTVTADFKLGGFWLFADYPFTMTSRAAGVSEIYWK